MNRSVVLSVALVAALLLAAGAFRLWDRSSAGMRRKSYERFAFTGDPAQVKAWVDKHHDECYRAASSSGEYVVLMAMKLARERAVAERPAREAEEKQKWADHQIVIQESRLVTVEAGLRYEVSLDLYDQKGDSAPETKPHVKWQVSCPGGGGRSSGGPANKVESTNHWQYTRVTHALDLSGVNRGTQPCGLVFAVGHADGPYSEPLKETLAPR
jgi:hypothetical protein